MVAHQTVMQQFRVRIRHPPGPGQTVTSSVDFHLRWYSGINEPEKQHRGEKGNGNSGGIKGITSRV
jgi:hypothetical protein